MTVLVTIAFFMAVGGGRMLYHAGAVTVYVFKRSCGVSET